MFIPRNGNRLFTIQLSDLLHYGQLETWTGLWTLDWTLDWTWTGLGLDFRLDLLSEVDI